MRTEKLNGATVFNNTKIPSFYIYPPVWDYQEPKGPSLGECKKVRFRGNKESSYTENPEEKSQKKHSPTDNSPLGGDNEFQIRKKYGKYVSRPVSTTMFFGVLFFGFLELSSKL